MSKVKKKGNKLLLTLASFSKKPLLTLASIFALSICVVYALYSLVSLFASSMVDKILFGSLGIGVWAVLVFFLLLQLGYNLELNLVKGDYDPALAIGLLVAITALAVGVVAVILGFVGAVAIVSVSIVLLGLSLAFSFDFFKMELVPFFLRIIVGAVIVGLLVGLAGFLA